nr:HDOD domain-containing protein [Planctomycetota bacterium]
MASVDRILKSLDRLPALPLAVTQLIGNLCGGADDPNAEPTERIVMSDSALSTAVLRLANSAAYGFQVPANSIAESLQRIGENQLLKIALSHASQETLGGPLEEYGLDAGDSWLGALAGALAAEEIAKTTRLADPNVAFTAGLLRDIGKLAMGMVVTPIEVQELMCVGAGDVMQREQQAFGFDHAQVGAALGRSWGLPVEVLHSIRFHHAAPTGDLADPLFDIVHCGDGLAMMLGYGVGYDGLAYNLGPDSQRLLGLDQERLESLLVKVRLRLREFLTEED